ncbi:MAG: hypothetical protein HETSPECPRED_006783 [Heterodermia speciosa]|uniref:EamA domain-containing protein n=1 Tax=Heterodermia speciosa TaxID=116794 RepID=A0A8H3FUX6_9LECA|nr:MAG: hypothetical protein HETSPECPRED_006783 [Heterodermia speciosa]
MDTQVEPLLPSSIPPESPPHNDPPPTPSTLARKTPWLALAAASGACAALNGVFAKLTTTALTTSISTSLAHFLHLSTPNRPIEYLFRAVFFLLNLAFNALMWALFTTALTRASSTTRVSIINTSANFMITALLGLAIFGERLPALWWVGAAGLVVGNVIIGRREEVDVNGKDGGREDVNLREAGEERSEGYRDQEGGRGDELELERRAAK